jgi:hypothetical protein
VADDTQDGYLGKYHLTTGKLIWEMTIPEPTAGSPLRRVASASTRAGAATSRASMRRDHALRGGSWLCSRACSSGDVEAPRTERPRLDAP